MQEIIVLGRVPGTSIQLSFTAWLYLVFSIALVALTIKTWREVITKWDIYRADTRSSLVFERMLHYRTF